MANIATMPSFFPRRLSQYVPALQYASDVAIGGDARISFGAPATLSVASLLSAQSINTAVVIPGSSMLNGGLIDTPYGRVLIIQLSGAGTGTVIVDGYDYLNQPMSETIAYNGAAIVSGNKAFKTIRQATFTLVAATTISIGASGTLGLPYRAIKVYTEEANSAPVSVGTFNAPSLVVPATLTTGDTRGTYLPTSTLNGVLVLTATFDFANDVDANNNGGLHGVPHFSN